MRRNSDACEEQIQITEVLSPYAQPIHNLFTEGLEFLRTALGARRVKLTRDGDVLDLGPDYQVRTTVLDLLVSLCVAGKIPAENRVPEEGVYIEEMKKWLTEEVRLGNMEEELLRLF